MADSALSANSPIPGVSVIIPAYNYAHYLPAAVDSVLGQDYPRLELIIVDDGSTDNTAEVIARYGDRVRGIHKTNAGLSAARNTGIREARFDYVCFLDADDILLPGHLSAAMQTINSLPETFAVVAFPAIYMDAAGKPLATKRLAAIGREITVRDIILKTRFPPSSTVVRRSVFAECGDFDETLRSSEDRDMWIRIAARRKIHLHGERLVQIRRHGTNMSRNADRMKTNTHRAITKAWQARCVPRSAIGFWLRVHAFRHFQAAWMYYEEARPGAAIRDILVSMLLWPWFPQPQELNEPSLFRLRSLRRFLMRR